MIAARRFSNALIKHPGFSDLARIKVELFGSLGATGKGHGSDKAILLGLSGEHPTTVEVDRIPSTLEHIRQSGSLTLPNKQLLQFVESSDLVMHKRKTLPFHTNGMLFTAMDKNKSSIFSETYYSVGGGFVVDETAAEGAPAVKADDTRLAYPFSSGDELLQLCEQHQMSIAQIMMANELSWKLA